MLPLLRFSDIAEVTVQIHRVGNSPNRRAVSWLIALLLAAQAAFALQELPIPGVPVDGSVSAEQLEEAIKAVETDEDLDEETRARVVEQLRDAGVQVQNRLAADVAASAYTDALTTAPAETERLRATLDDEAAPPPTIESLGISDDSTLAELEQGLAGALADLAAVDARVSALEAQIKTLDGQPAEARERINELRRSREVLVTSISAPPPPGEQQVLTDARRLSAELRRRAQAAEIDKLEQELRSHDVRMDLSKVQYDIAVRSLVELQRRVELFRAQVNAKRQDAAMLAQQTAEAAELAAADKHPVVRALAEANATLTSELPVIAADIERDSNEVDLVEAEARAIEERLARSRQRLEVGGLSRAIGRLLIEESRNLPGVTQYRSKVRKRRDTLTKIGLAQVRIEEQRRELTPLDPRVEESMAEVASDITAEDELESIRSEVRLLLRDRKALLNQVEKTYRSYLQVLGNLDVAQRRLLDSAAAYKDFLDQTLMWIPSAPIVGTGAWRDIAPATAWALSPTSWAATATAAIESLYGNAVAAVIAALLLAALVVIRRPLAIKYKSMSGRVGRLATDNIGLTLASLAIAATRALPLPLLLAVVGWALQQSEQESGHSYAVSRALFAVAPFLYNLLLFRILAAKDGVARVHFGWREENIAVVRRQLDRLIAIGVPLVFATVMLYSSEVAADRATLGRLAFVALMVTLTVVIRPLAHPEFGVAAAYYDRRPTSWVSRLRWLWYVLAAGLPLILAVIALVGYIYTSAILTGALVDTIWLLLGIIVANMVALRWLALARRKLAWQMALKEREARRAAKNKEPEQETEGELPVVASKPLDLDEVDQQTRKLLQSSLFLVAVLAGWGIWAEVLPAFSLLDRVALWSQTVMVDGVETIAPVTLADVLLAVAVAAVTAIAAKNLPGLMEILVLQRLTLQPGSRYAINTLVRYVVVIVGVFVVLNIVGWNWSQIQWLVAALGVGLGFGLQEIVANFVSGLVILFERPVRVGDTVTVGELTGTVSRVRIRATTITDWDRKEIIVPNKSFITEQVVNWTLTDPITRVVIPVGISYGSDVELAHRVMGDTLRSLPLVLDEPVPQVYFLGFGESSLDFKLYLYSRQLADRLPLMHAVHESILKALREHDIEIPFPQRDLHVRSTVENKNE